MGKAALGLDPFAVAYRYADARSKQSHASTPKNRHSLRQVYPTFATCRTFSF